MKKYNFLICIVMPTTTLQNLKLKYMDKQKRQILLHDKMN